MSTRSTIITKTADGFLGIYCHFDDYLEGVGATLQAHYSDPAKVARLIALGDLSQLGERVEPIGAHSYGNAEKGTCVAYMRDRGETGCEPMKAATAEEIIKHIDNGYNYVFDGQTWTVNGQPLALALAEVEK